MEAICYDKNLKFATGTSRAQISLMMPLGGPGEYVSSGPATSTADGRKNETSCMTGTY